MLNLSNKGEVGGGGFSKKSHKIEKCLLLFNANTNIFTLLTETAKNRRQKFHFSGLTDQMGIQLTKILK